MKSLIIITKTFLNESDKNKLILVLVGCLVFSNWYWYERENFLKQQELQKDARNRERESIYRSDNYRINNLLNSRNEWIFEHLEVDVEERKKINEDYKKLSDENKRLYDHVQKLLNQ